MSEFDARRFEELVLYVAERTRDDPEFGRTKLAKVLFYSDFDAYRLLGVPITGARYENWEHGPYPPRLKSATELLKNAQRVAIVSAEGPFGPSRLVPTGARPANLESVGVTSEQARIVDRWIDEIQRATAGEITRLSHDHPGYKMVARNGEIPYDSAFLADRPPSDEELETARRRARDRGLLVGDKWQR